MRSLSLIVVLASLAVLLERSEAFRFITPRRSNALKSTNLGRMSSLLASTEVETEPVEVDAEDSNTPEVKYEKGGKKKPLKLVNDKGGVKYKDDGTSYIMCSQCKSSYIYDEAIFGSSGKGKRVCCGVCGKEWFQSSSRVLTTDNANFLTGMTDNKVTEIRRAVEMRQWPRSPRVDRIGVFVGNLPYNYDETEIGDLFAEYVFCYTIVLPFFLFGCDGLCLSLSIHCYLLAFSGTI